jgi:tripeptidyl-peptidase-1
MIFSSGDNGVHETDDASSCSNNTFVVQFPGTCPYGQWTLVRSGSGTYTRDSDDGWSDSRGSRGSRSVQRRRLLERLQSSCVSRPAYQDTAVAAFLTAIPANFSGVFNRTGRAYPDVAMQGVNYTGVYGGTLYLNSGTSASAPAFASLIALLNARLVSEGRAHLGFLNREPWRPWNERDPGIKQTCSLSLRRGWSGRRIQRHNHGEQHWCGTA